MQSFSIDTFQPLATEDAHVIDSGVGEGSAEEEEAESLRTPQRSRLASLAVGSSLALGILVWASVPRPRGAVAPLAAVVGDLQQLNDDNWECYSGGCMVSSGSSLDVSEHLSEAAGLTYSTADYEGHDLGDGGDSITEAECKGLCESSDRCGHYFFIETTSKIFTDMLSIGGWTKYPKPCYLWYTGSCEPLGIVDNPYNWKVGFGQSCLNPNAKPLPEHSQDEEDDDTQIKTSVGGPCTHEFLSHCILPGFMGNGKKAMSWPGVLSTDNKWRCVAGTCQTQVLKASLDTAKEYTEKVANAASDAGHAAGSVSMGILALPGAMWGGAAAAAQEAFDQGDKTMTLELIEDESKFKVISSSSDEACKEACMERHDCVQYTYSTRDTNPVCILWKLGVCNIQGDNSKTWIDRVDLGDESHDHSFILKTCQNVEYVMVPEWKFRSEIVGTTTDSLKTTWTHTHEHTTSSDMTVTLSSDMTMGSAESTATLHEEFTDAATEGLESSQNVDVDDKDGHCLWQWVYRKHVKSADGPQVNSLTTGKWTTTGGEDCIEPPTCTPRSCR